MTIHASVPQRSTPLFAAWLACVAFVVYGSLVPLDFRPVPWDAALQRFQQMPMLKIGPESRADWISNIVLYVPMGFLTVAWCARMLPRVSRVGVATIAALFSVGMAIGVEFIQIFFPPRTVALNDIAAETLGAVFGIALANRSTHWLVGLIARTHTTSRQLWSRLLGGYAVVYVIYCLFPFDFVLTGSELSEKLRSDSWGWWMAGDGSSAFIRWLKPVLEVLLAMPLGWFAAGHMRATPSARWAGAALGGLLGLAIELAQLFMVSGISQGLSVLTRAIGLWAGVWLWRRQSTGRTPEQWARFLRRKAPLAIPAYLLALAQINHTLTANWLDWYAGLGRLADLQFLPFYYHYYTTEMQAVHSLASVSLSYAPIGVWVWAMRASPLAGSLLAAGLSALLEACKLWLPGVGIHPDPTNILIAASAAWLGCRLLEAASRSAAEPLALPRRPLNAARAEDAPSHQGKAGPALAAMPDKTVPAATALALSPTGGKVVFGLMLLAGALIYAIGFPFARAALVGVLIVAAAAVWFRPEFALTVCTAAAPALALAPWSGRLYIDELDAMFAALLGVAVWRSSRHVRAGRHADTMLRLVYGLLALALLVGIGRALLPWQPTGPETLADLSAPVNALRIAKGAVWATGFLMVMNRLRRSGVDVRTPLVRGLLAGLVFTLATIIWERAAFPGLVDFASDYRVTGPFADMNVGGAYIECYLVVVTPFLAVTFLRAQAWGDRLLLALLTCVLAYGVMVTFSRSGFAAFSVAVLITAVMWLRSRSAATSRLLPALALFVVVLLVSAPVFLGSFSQARWAAAETDLTTRVRHWDEGLQFRKPDAATSWFGVGLGRFPDAHYWNSTAPGRRGSFRLEHEGNNGLLRMGSGQAMYVEQFVDIQPGKQYVLHIDVRSQKELAPLRISVCERWMLTSYSCIELSAHASAQKGAWQSQEIAFTTATFTNGPWYARRPIKLALVSPDTGVSVDVDHLSLHGETELNLISNGDFSEGFDHWYFSADNHLAWHIKSLPLALLFDLGWLGVIAFGSLSVVAVTRAMRRAWNGDDFSSATLAALSGFLIVGLFDTLIDTPRFMFLFLLLCGMAVRRSNWKPSLIKA